MSSLIALGFIAFKAELTFSSWWGYKSFCWQREANQATSLSVALCLFKHYDYQKNLYFPPIIALKKLELENKLELVNLMSA